MTLEWIRFYLTAALIGMGLLGFGAAVLGVYRFGFVMNRMHSSGIGDTFGLFFIMLGLGVYEGISLEMLKMVLLVTFMWFSSPVSTHFLGQVEYYTNPHLYQKVERLGGEHGPKHGMQDYAAAGSEERGGEDR